MKDFTLFLVLFWEPWLDLQWKRFHWIITHLCILYCGIYFPYRTRNNNTSLLASLLGLSQRKRGPGLQRGLQRHVVVPQALLGQGVPSLRLRPRHLPSQIVVRTHPGRPELKKVNQGSRVMPRMEILSRGQGAAPWGGGPLGHPWEILDVPWGGQGAPHPQWLKLPMQLRI